MSESSDRKRAYRVTFTVDLEADSAEQAAKDAINKIRNDWALVVFNVQWTGFSEPPRASETQAAPTD